MIFKTIILFILFSISPLYPAQIQDKLFYCAIGGVCLFFLQKTNFFSYLFCNRYINLTDFYNFLAPNSPASIPSEPSTQLLVIKGDKTTLTLNMSTKLTDKKKEDLKIFLSRNPDNWPTYSISKLLSKIILYGDLDTIIFVLDNLNGNHVENRCLKYAMEEYQKQITPAKKDLYLDIIKVIINSGKTPSNCSIGPQDTHILKYAIQNNLPYDFIIFLMNNEHIQIYYKLFIACSTGDIRALRSLLSFNSRKKYMTRKNNTVNISYSKKSSSGSLKLGIIKKTTLEITTHKLLAWACRYNCNTNLISFLLNFMGQDAQKKALPYAFFQAIKTNSSSNIKLLNSLAQQHALCENFYGKILGHACWKLNHYTSQKSHENIIRFFIEQPSTNLYAVDPSKKGSSMSLFLDCFCGTESHKEDDEKLLLIFIDTITSKYFSITDFLDKQLQCIALRGMPILLKYRTNDHASEYLKWFHGLVNLCLTHRTHSPKSHIQFDYAKEKYKQSKTRMSDLTFSPLDPRKNLSPKDTDNLIKLRLNNLKLTRDLFLTEFTTIFELSHLLTQWALINGGKKLPDELKKHIIILHINNNIGRYIKCAYRHEKTVEYEGQDSKYQSPYADYYAEKKELKQDFKQTVSKALCLEQKSIPEIIDLFSVKQLPVQIKDHWRSFKYPSHSGSMITFGVFPH